MWNWLNKWKWRVWNKWRSSDGDVEPPPYKEGHPGNFKAVMDAMPGASTHQPLDDVDTAVERPGELDDLCCKIVSLLPFCIHARVRGLLTT